MQVLDHGRVELLDSMGDDLRVVNAAQASFDRSSTKYGERERKILRSLMREEHGVTFEHVAFTFRVRMPIFLARQYVKHRHASWSEHSLRYSEAEPLFYVPTQVRTQTGKPMEYQYEEAEDDTAALFRTVVEEHSWTGLQRYRSALDGGVAREQARLLLPINLYTTVVWTLNLRSLLNVLRLRTDAHAQHEAREYATALEGYARYVVPDTLDAWVEAGRPKP
jgi:thymidylate synthase (FAD)